MACQGCRGACPPLPPSLVPWLGRPPRTLLLLLLDSSIGHFSPRCPEHRLPCGRLCPSPVWQAVQRAPFGTFQIVSSTSNKTGACSGPRALLLDAPSHLPFPAAHRRPPLVALGPPHLIGHAGLSQSSSAEGTSRRFLRCSTDDRPLDGLRANGLVVSPGAVCSWLPLHPGSAAPEMLALLECSMVPVAVDMGGDIPVQWCLLGVGRVAGSWVPSSLGRGGGELRSRWGPGLGCGWVTGRRAGPRPALPTSRRLTCLPCPPGKSISRLPVCVASASFSNISFCFSF